LLLPAMGIWHRPPPMTIVNRAAML
jgi:hypothetical protein